MAPAFETWSKTQKIAIYSTGSVESQQLLFANTITGDLTAHISKYYDQETGLKTAPESYEKVAEDLGLKTEEIAFITDSVKGTADIGLFSGLDETFRSCRSRSGAVGETGGDFGGKGGKRSAPRRREETVQSHRSIQRHHFRGFKQAQKRRAGGCRGVLQKE